MTGEIMPLFNPRRDRWPEHFRLEAGLIVPQSAAGRATARLLQFNVPDRVEERRLLIRAGSFVVPE